MVDEGLCWVCWLLIRGSPWPRLEEHVCFFSSYFSDKDVFSLAKAAFIKCISHFSITLFPTTSPNQIEQPQNQFGWGRLISLVSSMETIFDSRGWIAEGIECEVFLQRSSAMSALIPFLLQATCSDHLRELYGIRWGLVGNGSSLNFWWWRLILGRYSYLESFGYRSSGMVASSIGSEIEMCFPHFWASFTTKRSVHLRRWTEHYFQGPYRRWYKR